MQPADPTGPDRDERDALAGEYVLGTLDATERAAAEARIAADPTFAVMVAEWQQRLQPLSDGLTPVTPPPHLWHGIAARIGDNSGGIEEGNVVALRRSLRRWKLATAAAAAMAASLIIVVALERSRPPPETEFVAVLTAPDGTTPAFVASVDVATRTVEIIRVATSPPADKSYELWSIAPAKAPVSLGVIEQASYRHAIGEMPSPDITLAITLEQKGGSPTGAPQGPLVFKGTLLPAR